MKSEKTDAELFDNGAYGAVDGYHKSRIQDKHPRQRSAFDFLDGTGADVKRHLFRYRSEQKAERVF